MEYTEQYWENVEKVVGNIREKEQLFGKTFLVTGASGMICSTVIDLLLYLNNKYNAGIKVFAAGRSEERMKNRFDRFTKADGLLFWYYDAISNETLKFEGKLDYVIHGASNANPAVYMTEPVETILANVVGLNNVLKLASEKSVARLLYISSSEVYGKKENNLPYSESDYGFLDILNERAGYPASKRTGESLCISYDMEYGLDTVIVRPGHIYGPSIIKSDVRASADFTRRAVAGEDIVMKSAGDQIRSYCHTLDCASAIISVLLNGKSRNAYNISNPNSICTIRDIAIAIAKHAGVRVVMDIPTDFEKKGYNLMNNSSLTSEKLEKLGWKPTFSLDEGVESMIKQLKETRI